MAEENIVSKDSRFRIVFLTPDVYKKRDAGALPHHPST